MPNKIYAQEWLVLAKRNLETALLLLKENHYTDIIAIEIQQTVEKSLKAVYAYHGVSIPKTHILPVLFKFALSKVNFQSIEFDDIIIISDYYETDRYPGPKYFIPDRKEIEKYVLLAEEIYNIITSHINKIH